MDDQFTKILKALTDPSRRKIFHTLIVLTTALPINQIAVKFDMSRQGVTKHIKILEAAGLVEINTKGRVRYCQANASPLKELKEWLNFYEQFWTMSLDNLSSYLDSNK